MVEQAKKFDAIVVGAGINGLACAVHLATKGWQVLVVEKNAVPGGAVKTLECTLPGFAHDLFAMNLSMFAGSSFYAEHGPLLEAHGCQLLRSRKTFASAFPDGSWLGVDQDIEATTRQIGIFSRKDAERWKEMVAGFEEKASYLFKILSCEMPSLQAAKAVLSAWWHLRNPWLKYAGALAIQTPREWLDNHLESDKLKAAMAVWAMHLDFSPETAGGAMFPYLESMACQSFGMALGRRGASTVINSMVSALEFLQGKLLLGTAVKEIEVTGKRATGVVLEDGRRFGADRAVIANLVPKTLVACLPLDAKVTLLPRLEKFKHGPGTMMIHLATDKLPTWSAGKELSQFAYVHLAPTMSAMTIAYTQALDGLLPVEPVVVVGQPSAIDPERAPAGKHVLWIQVRVVPGEIRGDALHLLHSRDWAAVKEAYADRVLEIIERYAPSLQSSILARTVFSPDDIECDNPNLVGGDNAGGSHHPGQNFFLRPAWNMSRYRTPIKALYLVGASTWPGGGTGAGSGYLCGRQLAGK